MVLNAIGIYGDAGAEIKDGMTIPIKEPVRTTKVVTRLWDEATNTFVNESRDWNPATDESIFQNEMRAYNALVKERIKDHGSLWNFLRRTVGKEILNAVDAHKDFQKWLSVNDTYSYYREMVNCATIAASRQGETLKNRLVNQVKQMGTDNCEQFLGSFVKLTELIVAAGVEMAEKHQVKVLQLCLIQSQFQACPEYASVVPHEWQSSKFPDITLPDFKAALYLWYQGTQERDPNYPKFDAGGCSIDRLLRGEFDGALVVPGVGSDGKVARAFSTTLSNQVAMSNSITRDLVMRNAYANSTSAGNSGGGSGGDGGAKAPNPHAAEQRRLAEQYAAQANKSSAVSAECQNCGETGHFSGKCPYELIECFACKPGANGKRKNHLPQYCWAQHPELNRANKRPANGYQSNNNNAKRGGGGGGGAGVRDNSRGGGDRGGRGRGGRDPGGRGNKFHAARHTTLQQSYQDSKPMVEEDLVEDDGGNNRLSNNVVCKNQEIAPSALDGTAMFAYHHDWKQKVPAEKICAFMDALFHVEYRRGQKVDLPRSA